MANACNASKPIEASKFPCRVCNKGVESNFVKSLVCGFPVHKCFSNVKISLKPNPDFKCKKCKGEISNMAIPDIDPVNISGEAIEKIQVFLLPW